jgi:hypothetical protein
MPFVFLKWRRRGVPGCGIRWRQDPLEAGSGVGGLGLRAARKDGPAALWPWAPGGGGGWLPNILLCGENKALFFCPLGGRKGSIGGQLVQRRR